MSELLTRIPRQAADEQSRRVRPSPEHKDRILHVESAEAGFGFPPDEFDESPQAVTDAMGALLEQVVAAPDEAIAAADEELVPLP